MSQVSADILRTKVNMAYMSKDEEALISFLRGVNQVQLSFTLYMI